MSKPPHVVHHAPAHPQEPHSGLHPQPAATTKPQDAPPSRQVSTAAINEELAKIEADTKIIADPNMPEVTVRAAASKIAGNVTRIRAVLKGE